MKLTDALASVLDINDMHQIFGLQGGAVVHVFDSLERYGIDVTYTHHEESAALAAVAYAKATENIGCVVVTTGPGGTNAITGLLAAWQDSVPCLFISGQARTEHTSYGRNVRQVGTQEANICDIVRPICKYCICIKHKDDFIRELTDALKIARSGRPGPVWIDLPLDLQWADIEYDDDATVRWQKPEVEIRDITGALGTLDMLNQAEAPLLILGYGLRLAGRSPHLDELIQQRGIPFVTTWTATDLFPTDHSLNLGRIGMNGQRGANKAVFAADLLICLGTHLSIPHTTTLFSSYAPQARKIIVNIDADQLANLNIRFDIALHEDVNTYLKWLCDKDVKKFHWPDAAAFKGMNWYEPKMTERPNSNQYIRTLSANAPEHTCIVVDGGGTALYAGFQSSIIKETNRIICSSSISSMGTGLAETIGVAKSQAFEKLLCIIGDGSFLMNVQDLQTIRQHNIDVVISVINNNGYLAIRHTQKEFMEGRYYGTHPNWNLAMPSIEKIAYAFEIPHIQLTMAEHIDATVQELYALKGPVICEVVVDEHQDVLFKQYYKTNNNGMLISQPLSEMFPF